MPRESLPGEGHRHRLRHRAETEGWDALRPAEMVELVLTFAVPRQDLSDVADALIRRFGSVGDVFTAEMDALLAVEGMTPRLAEWVTITGDLMRAYSDLDLETDIRLSCYQEVLDFLAGRLERGATGLWALYADMDFNLITYSDFGPAKNCWAPAIARRMFIEAIDSGARYVYLVRLLGDAPPRLSDGELARLEALANTFQAADFDLVDCVLVGRGAFASLRAAGYLMGEATSGRAAALREAYLQG